MYRYTFAVAHRWNSNVQMKKFQTNEVIEKQRFYQFAVQVKFLHFQLVWYDRPYHKNICFF